MTPEEIEALQKDEDFKKFLDAQLTEATKGLVSKNEELLAKLKSAKENQLPLSKEELEELQNKAKIADELERKNLEKKGEYEKLMEKIKEQKEQEVSSIKAALEKEQSLNRKLLVDGQLLQELAQVKVNPALITAAVKLLEDEIQVVEENGNKVARVGEKTISEFVKEWAESEIGKNFVLAPGSSGGGASNNGGDGGGANEYEKYFKPESYNLTKQIECKTKEPEVYKMLSEKYNNTRVMPSGFQSNY